MLEIVTQLILSLCCTLQFLEDVGLQRDAIPLGRELAGVVQQGGKLKNV